MVVWCFSTLRIAAITNHSTKLPRPCMFASQMTFHSLFFSPTSPSSLSSFHCRASSHVVSHVKEHVSNRWQQHHHGSPSLPAMASSAQQETQSPGPRSSPPMSPQSPVSPSTASSPQAPQVPPPPSYQTSSPSSPGNQGTGGRQLFQAMAKARASKESVNE